jgi:monovalent cation/hydrogen antiporter
MDPFIIYLILFSIVVLLGQIFQKSTVPIALILVIFGMILSFIPFFPEIHIDSKLVLNIFLPLLIYQISAFSTWRDIKKQARPITLLSIGHVLFITILVALVIHTLIPQMGWPLAFALGAIISPPDDVAIVAIAEKVRIPERMFLILEGEGMFNDAAALTIFRFALAAAITNQFSFTHAVGVFSAVILGETLYGFLLGHLLGQLRIRIANTKLHVIASLITPFLAYIPMEKLGGSGIIATAIVGFIIGNQYTLRFTPEYRLASLMIWPMLAYAIQAIIFLLVGLDLRANFIRITSIPLESLAVYVASVIAVVIIGRFIWVYGFVIFVPGFIFPFSRKMNTRPWKTSFLISWAGIRGGISLAAALAIPPLALQIDNVNIRDLLIFIVFCTIFVTLVLQGLSLPYFLKKIGIDKIGQSERYTEHMNELQARIKMIRAALKWLHQYKSKMKHDKKVSAEISMYIYEYELLKNQFESRIVDHDKKTIHALESEIIEKSSLLLQIAEIEKAEITKLWFEDKINLKTRNKLISILDHQIQRSLI